MSKYVVKAEIEYLVEAGTPDGAYRKFAERMVTDFNIDCDMNAPTITLRSYRGLEVKLLEIGQDSIDLREKTFNEMGLSTGEPIQAKPSLAEEYSGDKE